MSLNFFLILVSLGVFFFMTAQPFTPHLTTPAFFNRENPWFPFSAGPKNHPKFATPSGPFRLFLRCNLTEAIVSTWFWAMPRRNVGKMTGGLDIETKRLWMCFSKKTRAQFQTQNPIYVCMHIIYIYRYRYIYIQYIFMK